MNEILFYVAIGVGALFLSLMIPGVKVISEAIVKALFEFLIELIKHKGAFFIWFVKTILGDHARVFMHAVRAEDDIDPTQKVRRAAAGEVE